MIPETTRAALLSALDQFDREFRGTETWEDWEDNKAHKYAIQHQGVHYPIKQIISLATGIPTTDFSGGVGAGQANQYVERYDLTVINLRPKNPTWTRDELILALDLYLRHRDAAPAKNSNEIVELSTNLNRLGSVIFGSRTSTFRNQNGVYLKLMNFRSLDPIYTSDGRVGMQRRGKGDEQVWAEFAENPENCHRTALAIMRGLKELEERPEGDDTSASDGDFVDAPEGRVLTRLHTYRERDRKLVTRKKEQRIKATGKLVCEACNFDFENIYGNRGNGFIEAHHSKPVSELGDGHRTRLEDLILLCSNCHRMVHTSRPWLSLRELKELIKS